MRIVVLLQCIIHLHTVKLCCFTQEDGRFAQTHTHTSTRTIAKAPLRSPCRCLSCRLSSASITVQFIKTEMRQLWLGKLIWAYVVFFLPAAPHCLVCLARCSLFCCSSIKRFSWETKSRNVSDSWNIVCELIPVSAMPSELAVRSLWIARVWEDRSGMSCQNQALLSSSFSSSPSPLSHLPYCKLDCKHQTLLTLLEFKIVTI